MPNQTFCCVRHDEFDVQVSFKDDIPKMINCPKCGQPSQHILKAPIGVIFKRDWNEQANESQRNPYIQAKAQATNMYNEQRDAGNEVSKPTEEGIQIAAAHIAKTKR